MFLSPEIDIKLLKKVIPKRIYVRFCKRFVVLNRFFNKCANNLKTTISQRSLRNSSLLLLLFEFNNFLFLIDIIDNIIYTSGTCDLNSNQWQCSIIVTCVRLYPVTSILHCHWREFWSRDTDVYFTYIRVGIILTQVYVNFSRQELQIDVFTGIVHLLKFSGFSLYSFQFSFTFPLRKFRINAWFILYPLFKFLNYPFKLFHRLVST